MDDSKNVEALKLLAGAAAGRERARLKGLVSVRVAPGVYLAAASVLTFASVMLLHSDRDLWALLALAAAWLVVPALALSDRIAFDGQSLTRRGPIPFIGQLISARRRQFRITDFEKVDTRAVRTLRRGGRVRYRYRSQITGKGKSFVLASGGKGYREMVRQLFPLIHEAKIDARTRELRDYLCEPRTLARHIESLRLASSVVLDNASSDLKEGIRTRRAAGPADPSPEDLERARLLRRLANELRVAGRLGESREAFRRALIVLPRDAWLIYEFARLLRSQASAVGDERLLLRARAALRLSASRAGEDGTLLALIGESLVECGDVALAERMLRRAVDCDSQNSHAWLELADIALRNGKLAHVIHHYRDAARVAPDKALAAYARREADYYARLNDDEDYLATELRRISWLQNTTRVRRLAARAANASILIALVGPYIDPTAGSIGWSLASSSLVAWVSTICAVKFLSDRRKPRLVE
jgi:tetratricopeptide (TPR) repeat protein